MTTVLKWAWVHGALEVDEFDDLDEAVQSAYYCADYGTESLNCVEVVGEKVYSRSEVWELTKPLEEADRERRVTTAAPILRLDVQAPSVDGVPEGWGHYDWYRPGEETAALIAQDEWAEKVGPERVRLVDLRGGKQT